MSTDKKEYTQEQLARMFVDNAKDYKKHVQSRSMTLDEELNFYIKEMGAEKGAGVAAAVDALLYNNPEFRAKFNSLPENRKNPLLQVSYDVTASVANDEKYFEGQRKYERTLDTASNPGGSNLVQTALADTIIHKMEEIGQIISLIQKDTVPYGDKEYPRLTAKAEGVFIDENSTASTAITANTYEVATDGITKVKYTPRDFVLRATYTKRLLNKVSPASVSFFRQYEAQGLTRGIERQILRGNATGQNAQGIAGIATVVAVNGDEYLTFNDATGILGASDTDNIVAVMSRKTWARFKQLRVANDYFISGAIDPKGKMVDDIPIIISNNINASEATTGTVILGDFNHYLMLTSGGLETLEDPYSEAANRRHNVFHSMQIDLGALIPASFATFNVTY
jgi:HK97 family phage major capsid protein